MKHCRSVFAMDIAFDCSKNIWKNALIALQIALLVWASTLLASFFVPHVTTAQPDEQGGYYFYSMNTNLLDTYLYLDQKIGVVNDQAYIENFARLWQQLHSQEEFSFYLCQENVFEVAQHSMTGVFRGKAHLPFAGKPVYDSALSTELFQTLPKDAPWPDLRTYQPDGVARYSFLLKEDAYAMQSFLLDEGAMTHFGLSVSSGRLFDETDFAVKKTDDETTSILLGSAYQDYYALGDTIDFSVQNSSTRYTGTVVGFLAQGNCVTVQDDMGSYMTAQESLDHAIVFPFTLYEGSYLYKVSSAYASTYTRGWGVVPSVSEQNPIAWLRLQKKVQDFYLQADLPPQQMGNVGSGMLYFQRSTTEELMIILSLFATALVFGVYTVATFLKTKLLRARKYYAIQILCGRAPRAILWQVLFMQAFWHLLAAVVVVAVWVYQMMGGWKLPVLSVSFSVLLFAGAAVQIVFLQQKLFAQTDFMQHIMEVQND